MKVSSSVAAARKVQASARRSSARAIQSRRGAINLSWFGDFHTRYDQRPQSIEASIFYKMAMKPIPLKQLKKQGFDLESGAKKLTQQFGIDPSLVEIRAVRVPASNEEVKILIVKQPDYVSQSEQASNEGVLLVPGQHGNIVQAINTGEVKKHWSEGKNVVLATMRGYHGNRGQVHHIGQAHDLAAIMDYIHDRMKIKPENTSIQAHSMGCDTFINANAIRAQQGSPHNYDAIELRAPYKSMAEMIKHKIASKWYLKPFRSQISGVMTTLSREIMDSFENLRYLAARRLRIIASPRDEKIPFVQSSAVKDEIHRLHPNMHLVFFEVPDYASGDHDSVCFPHYHEHLSSKGSQ